MDDFVALFEEKPIFGRVGRVSTVLVSFLDQCCKLWLIPQSAQVTAKDLRHCVVQILEQKDSPRTDAAKQNQNTK
jgi:hypothetical protein